jgi:RNA recognition motif-containing protein
VNIYVGNLSAEISERELQLEFEAFGEVAHVVIMSEWRARGGRSSGYGFVEMASKIAGAAAIAGLNGKWLKSRHVDVVEALPLSDKTKRRGERKDNLPVVSQNREAL